MLEYELEITSLGLSAVQRRKHTHNNLCINLDCLSVRLYPINVKTAEPIGPKLFV